MDSILAGAGHGAVRYFMHAEEICNCNTLTRKIARLMPMERALAIIDTLHWPTSATDLSESDALELITAAVTPGLGDAPGQTRAQKLAELSEAFHVAAAEYSAAGIDKNLAYQLAALGPMVAGLIKKNWPPHLLRVYTQSVDLAVLLEECRTILC